MALIGADFPQGPRAPADGRGVDLFEVNQPEPERFAIELGAGFMVMVLVSQDGQLLMGFFRNGELLHTMSEPIGEA